LSVGHASRSTVDTTDLACACCIVNVLGFCPQFAGTNKKFPEKLGIRACVCRLPNFAELASQNHEHIPARFFFKKGIYWSEAGVR
jgi:hypothetical protein